MTAQKLAIESMDDMVARLARAGRAAQAQLARLGDEGKAAALRSAATALREAEPDILAANARDVAAGEANGLTGAMLDRLRLDPARLAAIADAVDQVAALPDPVGQVIDASARPNGLQLSRVRVPIGLIDRGDNRGQRGVRETRDRSGFGRAPVWLPRAIWRKFL